MPLFPRALAVLVAGLMISQMMTAFAKEAVFYLGTYAKTPGEGIFRGTLDTATGKLGPLKLLVEEKNPAFVALGSEKKHLYAVLEADTGLGAYQFDEAGTLRLLNKVETGGGAPCHLVLDRTGRYVFVANYTGGSVDCFRIRPDGSLGEKTAFIVFTGTGADPQRQSHPHGHAVAVDSGNRFVYACDLGTDKVWTYRFDVEKGTLTPVEPAGMTPPAAGPRHIVFSQDEKFAYVNNEMGMSVTVFRHDPATGVLTALQTIPLSPENPGPKPGLTTSEIILHPSGQWLYVTSRGDDQIAMYRIGPDGFLTHVENVPATVKTPRGAAVDPSGRWLIAAGQADNQIAVLRIDPETGRLSPTGVTAEVGAPVGVTFEP